MAAFTCTGVLCAVASITAFRGALASPVGSIHAVADSQGNLHVPENYRTQFEYLGTWSVAAGAEPGAKELHIVFASPGSVTAYKSSGAFPDGTVLVKEVVEATTSKMTTGTVSRYNELKGWFVMQKDSKNTRTGNPLWGEGWGWSWFDAGKPTKTTSTDYKKDCLGCHVPARDTDWIYVQGYPALRR